MSKHEMRNKFKTLNSNDGNRAAPPLATMFPADFVSFLGHLDFVLVSHFDIRISFLKSNNGRQNL